MSRPREPQVVVVGAGFTGLLAARRAAQAGCRVIVLDASEGTGGQVRTTSITTRLTARPLDVGSEATHLMYPQVGALIDELGLRETMVTARPGTSWLWTPRGLAPLPEGVGPAGPTRLVPVLRARVLSPAALVRAGLEPLLAGRHRLGDEQDMAVRDFVAGRFGAQVADRLVDPLLGSLHSGNVRQLSLRACAPSLVPAATTGRSLLRASRRRRATGGRTSRGASQQASPGRPAAAGGRPSPVSFVSWPDGLSTLTDALLTGLPPGAVEVRLGHRVSALTRPAHAAYRLRVEPKTDSDAYDLDADGVILAIPAARATELLRPVAPHAADQFTQTPTADIATIVIGVSPAAVRRVPAMRGNGLLVPSTHGSLLKASTFLSNKWAHLDDDDVFWLRMSAGRAGDERLATLSDSALLDAVCQDLHTFTGFAADPDVVHIQRWPAAMPQLTVGHTARVASARADLAQRLPGLGVAGASYDGVGLASCITSATRTTRQVLTDLGTLETATD